MRAKIVSVLLALLAAGFVSSDTSVKVSGGVETVVVTRVH
jgi:hypothetical protein